MMLLGGGGGGAAALARAGARQPNKKGSLSSSSSRPVIAAPRRVVSTAARSSNKDGTNRPDPSATDARHQATTLGKRRSASVRRAAAPARAPVAAPSPSSPSDAAAADASASRAHLPDPAPFPSGPPAFSATCAGSPEPLGPSPTAAGVNFAVYAPRARAVTLILHGGKDGAADGPRADVSLPMQRSAGVWHLHVDALPRKGVRYGYRVEGEEGTGRESTGHRWRPDRVLLDPYAPLVWGRRAWAERDEAERFVINDGSTWWGAFDFASEPFDWGDDDLARPNTPAADLVVYEMAVRCFTADPSSGVPSSRRGGFLGVADRADHLQRLGVSAVELLPVFEYDELEFRRWRNPREHMVNVWGYSHVSFFAPMARFGSAAAQAAGDPAAAAREFKQMVKELHARGIQVILDVVYNHTAELDDANPYTIHFRGLDAPTYYMLGQSDPTDLVNYSGCGNTVSGNSPVTRDLIVASLVHWVTEYRVDGFRFDLASCLCRDAHGRPLPAPPLIKDIARHPVLSRVHLIAEPWDIGMYQVGGFPSWDVWGEWNGRYRDDVRRFVKGDAGCKAAFATRMAGSADLYDNHGRRWWHGVNFVTAHDGFSLYDLVSYESKRNGDNGEQNRDGSNDNFSWNCGHEGGSDVSAAAGGGGGGGGRHGGGSGGGGSDVPAGVAALRLRQARNFWCALMLAQGVPMVVMGDELLQTHWGNNNWYGHDARLAHMHWSGPLAEKEGGGGDENAAPAATMTAATAATAEGDGGGGAAKKGTSSASPPSAASLALTEPARPPAPPDDARAELLRFASELVRWRRGPARALFAGREGFLGDGDVTWHERDWGNAESRFLAWTLHDNTGSTAGCGDVYVAFNAHPFLVDAPLPGPVGRWARLIDTALPAPRDFTPGGNGGGVTTGSYGVQGHSCVVLISRWGEEAQGGGGASAAAAAA